MLTSIFYTCNYTSLFQNCLILHLGKFEMKIFCVLLLKNLVLLFATHPLVMIIICATLFINPNIDDQVMDRHIQVSLKSLDKV